MSTMRPLSLVKLINRPRPVILAVDHVQSHRTGSIVGLSGFEIAAKLGLAPGPGIEGQTRWEWEFTIDGQPCAIWDYHQHRNAHPVNWSCFGPRDALVRVFGEDHVA